MIYNLPRKKKAAIQVVGMNAFESTEVSQIISLMHWLDDGTMEDSDALQLIGQDTEWLENSTHFISIGKPDEYIFTFDQNNDALNTILEALNLQNAEDLYGNYDCAVVCVSIGDAYDPTADYRMTASISDIIFDENVDYLYFFVIRGETQSNGKYEESIVFTDVVNRGDENGYMNITISKINADNNFYLVVIYPKQ